MSKAPVSVIKHDEVRIAGKVRLDSGMPRSADSLPAGQASCAGEPAGAASARIVKTAADHVMIEVTCACGAKTMLRCDY